MINYELVIPFIYWLLVLIWLYISLVYFLKTNRSKSTTKAIRILLLILAIDAFRTVLESVYFGTYFTSFYGLIDSSFYEFLSIPQILFLPKLLNLAAAILILSLLLKDSLPDLIKNDETQRNELIESERTLRAAIKYSPNPVFIHAEDGEMLFIADKVTEITGYEESEIKTLRDWTKRAHREKSGTMLDMIHHIYKLNQKKKIGELDIHTKDGRVLTWDFDLVPLGNTKDGRKTYLITAVDVTAKKENIKQLMFTEFSVNHVGLDIIWLDREGIVHSYNQHAEDTLLSKEASLGGVKYEEIQADNNKTSWSSIINQVEKKGTLSFVRNLKTKLESASLLKYQLHWLNQIICH